MARLTSGILAALVVVCFVACGGGGSKSDDVDLATYVPDQPSARHQEARLFRGPDPDWKTVTRTIRLGNATVSAVKVLATSSATRIDLEIKNTSDTKVITYKGLGAVVWGDQKASLFDEHKNRYQSWLLKFDDPLQPRQLKNTPIHPGNSITDVLVFDAVTEKATKLRLEIPGSAVGESGLYSWIQVDRP